MGFFTKVIDGAPAELPVGAAIGEYVVEAIIGQGGFGTVYRVEHPVIGKHAAAKVLARQFTHDETAVGRFIEEARAVNTIRSTHILDIFSFGELEDGRRYFVMELLEGESLARHIGRRARVPPEELMVILEAIAEALDAAHERDIVHRDLKPDNIFLHCAPSGEIVPKLLDFGAAKLLGNRTSGPKTNTGTTLGTPYYMSPEQCLALSIDHRSDIYAYGVLCFEALTGQLPFEGKSFFEVASHHSNSERPLVSSRCPELGEAFDEAVATIMAVDPADRPETVRAAYELLEACLTQSVRRVTIGNAALDRDAISALSEEPTALHPVVPPSASPPSDSSGADSSEADSSDSHQSAGPETDSSAADNSEQDGPESDGSETDRAEQDGPESDVPETDRSAQDGPDTTPPEGVAEPSNVPASSRAGSITLPSAGPESRSSPVRAWLTWLGTALVLAVALWAITQTLWPARPATQLPSPDAAPSDAAPRSAASYGSRIEPHHLRSFQPLPVSVPVVGQPLTNAQVQLGHRLFYEPQLSRDRDLSCSSCHHAAAFGADSRRFSPGHAGQLGQRNVPTVYNVAGAFAFNWDGRAATLEQQAAIPLLSARTMAMTEDEVVNRLKAEPSYVKAFESAFGGETPVSFENVTRALGAYQRRLFTPSRWDDFLAGDDKALPPQEKRGFNAFVAAGCPTCHYGSRIGLTLYQKLGLVNPWPDSSDPGRQGITMNAEDWMIFRVPTLRNVSGTAPYLHDGSVKQLREVVRLMAYHQLDRKLPDADIDLIVAWLGSLTGRLPKDLTTPP